MSVTTVDPSTGRPLATYQETTPEELDVLLDRARVAAEGWRETSPAQRADGLRRLAQVLTERREELALLATREMGKPLPESRAEVEKCARTCNWFAEHAPALLEPEKVQTEAVRTKVIATPLGVLLAIMPWNFPYWQVVRALAPALAAGNVVVLKHAASTTGSALALADAAAAAGLPAGALSVIVVDVDRTAQVVDGVIADDRVAAVTLTGSTRAGRSVATAAGRALKKTVLELGGSDAFVVLADADLDAAAAWGARSRFQNTGQSCIAAKRIVVEDPVADAFTEKLLAQVATLRLGDPTAEGVTVGPLAREDLRDALDRQVRDSVAQGARVLAGGRVPDRAGFYYEPTVVDRVEQGMPVLDEEVFGPAVPILRARNADEALELANATTYGLGSAVWTSDLARGEAFAEHLDAGHTAVNGMTVSDPRLPFGGVKDSGYGRELSHHGLFEFVDIHAVVVNDPDGPREERRTASE
ncbi:MAG TPA: NAD-dependent succinate-semialdehyde dehydrogenase [Acidimicrobiales bacterium]|nr:NAD-dependent succinate-semialdehyde dehydrogenase [Acidimicrobiales bacterium]